MPLISIKLIIILLLSTLYLHADEYVVVSNRHIKTLSLAEIKAIYLKKLSYTEDTKFLPINLSLRDKIRKSFEKNVLQMNLIRLNAYWTKQHYLGHRPPLTMKSQEAVKKLIKKVDGAIGYINIDSLDDDLLIIYQWSDK